MNDDEDLGQLQDQHSGQRPVAAGGGTVNKADPFSDDVASDGGEAPINPEGRGRCLLQYLLCGFELNLKPPTAF